MLALGLLPVGGEFPPRYSRANPGSLRRDAPLGERFGLMSGELLWVWGEDWGVGIVEVNGFCGLCLNVLVVDVLVGCALDSRGCITF